MPDPRSAGDRLPLSHNTLLILLALAESPLHGYGIIRAVHERSDGTITLQTGGLYREIKHLLADGLIAECAPPSHIGDVDERRRYYRNTALGAQVLAAEIDRLSKLVRAARAIEAGRRPRFA
jgi:PadR family transcriptional regulator